MYIQRYQIHNVLDVYRKQLSHGPGLPKSQNSKAAGNNNQVTSSSDGQRKSIMDKISTEIVERIAQTGPKNKFESALAGKLSTKSAKPGSVHHQMPEFRYTVIDEHNRKITNTLPIQGYRPQTNETNGTGSKSFDNSGKNPISPKE